MDESNPYRSPVDPQPGEYDHSLFWRLVKIAAVFYFFFAAVDVWAWYRYAPDAMERNTAGHVVRKFFTDWTAGKLPPKQPAD
jgi:hypothetical protein